MGDQLTTYQRCEWQSSGSSCRYPATISRGGPWYCTLHSDCRTQAEGVDICKASNDYIPPEYVPGNRCAIVDALAARSELEARAAVPAHIRAMTPAQCMDALNALSPRLSTAPRDGLAWARRIQQREAAGEHVGLCASQMAEEALHRIRQPGDDDEEPAT